MANAILCVVGWGLVLSGLWFLGQTSEREPKVKLFNKAVGAWNQTVRQQFAAATFSVVFAECATCDAILTVPLDPAEGTESFSKDERLHAAERSSYVPLRFTSRSVRAMDLRQGSAVASQPIDVVVEVTDAKGTRFRLPVGEPLSLYSVEPGHGNEKVCRNERGEYIGGRCYFRWFLRSLCFSVVQDDRGQWQFDPETPGLGCDVYDNWNYAQYAKDVAHDDRLENGDFTFGINVRHGDDPMLIARDVTGLERPNFGESAEDLRTEGWVTLGFGLVILCAPTFQVYCHWKQKRDWELRTYGHTDETERVGLISQVLEGNFLGRQPNLPNPLNIV